MPPVRRSERAATAAACLNPSAPRAARIADEEAGAVAGDLTAGKIAVDLGDDVAVCSVPELQPHPPAMLPEIGLCAGGARTRVVHGEDTARASRVFPQTVESVNLEIERVVAERQALRAAGADAATLEENRQRLASAQARLSQLLIERHLPDRRIA